MREIIRRLVALLRWRTVTSELDEELRLHVELRQARLIENGVPAERAYTLARRRFGNMAVAREDSLGVWGWQWPGQLAQDLRFGLRTLGRDRVFAISAILTLGVAIGATTAVFSLINGLLLRPLPFPEPDRLIAVHGRNWGEDRGNTPDPMTAPVGSRELEALAQADSFEAVAGYAASTRHLEGAAGVERVRVVTADPSFFNVLGINAIVGRTFQAGDPDSVAVLSERAWRDRFNADRQIVGRSLSLEGRPLTVVGVMPESFEFPYYRSQSSAANMTSGGRAEVWMLLPPLRVARDGSFRGGRVDVVARLKRGVSFDQAAAELGVIAKRVEAQYFKETRNRSGLRAVALDDEVLAPVRSSLWLLFAAVALVLTAACANVANLLLARMLARNREVATRAALGAGALRLVRQFFTESLLLSTLGGLVGIAIAWWGSDALIGFYRGRLPRLHEISLDWRTFAFLSIACTVAAGVFGIAPAIVAARTDPYEVTKTAGHASHGARTRYVRDALVILEVTLAFVLAVAATIVIREIQRLERVPTGMTVENVIVLHLTPQTTAADYHAIEERAATIPGVEATGFIQYVPLQNSGWTAGFEVKGRPAPPGERLVTDLRYVTAGYFRAAGIPVLSGRNFITGDTAKAPLVVLVNQAFARRYFPGEDPVGRELNRGIIIGIVGDVRSAELARPAEPELYYNVDQNIASTDAGLSLVVRSSVAPETLVGSLRATVSTVNPRLAIFNIKTMEQIVGESLWQLTLYRWLIGVFAALALTLAAVGLFGLIAYTANSRLHELAIRRALGSDQWTLAGLIFERGLKLAAAGVASGIVAVLAGTWWLGDRAAGLRPDVATCLIVSTLVLVITVVACFGPSMRAATVNPMAALRQE